MSVLTEAEQLLLTAEQVFSDVRELHNKLEVDFISTGSERPLINFDQMTEHLFSCCYPQIHACCLVN